MYRSDGADSEESKLSLHEKSLPVISPDTHPTKPRIVALTKFQKAPLGLSFAAGILFISGLAVLGGRSTELFLLQKGVEVAERITEQGMLQTQISLVRPLGSPVALFVRSIEAKK